MGMIPLLVSPPLPNLSPCSPRRFFSLILSPLLFEGTFSPGRSKRTTPLRFKGIRGRLRQELPRPRSNNAFLILLSLFFMWVSEDRGPVPFALMASCVRAQRLSWPFSHPPSCKASGTAWFRHPDKGMTIWEVIWPWRWSRGSLVCIQPVVSSLMLYSLA